MARMELAELFEPFEIGFGDGHDFVLREATLTAIEKIEAAEAQVQDLQTSDDRTTYGEALIALIDAYLEPVANGDGKKSYAKTILGRQFKGNEIGLDRLSRLALMLQEEGEKRFHPPSPETSGE